MRAPKPDATAKGPLSRKAGAGWGGGANPIAEAQAGVPLLSRRGFLAASLALPALATPALALPAIMRATPPAPPLLSLIVGSPSGRGSDPSARAFAPFLERHLRDVRVAVLNRPGEAGLAALRLLADAAPNGLTLGWVASPTLPARMVDRDADDLLDRLRLVGAVQKEPIVFVSCPRSPLASVADLLRRAGEDSAAIPLGTPPEGSAGHLAALRLQALAGTPLNLIAFPSSAAARQAAQQGHVAAAALAMADAIDALREGSVAGLGVAARRPYRAMPTVAPLHASGVALSAAILRGLAVPATADASRIGALQAALLRVAADPEFIAAGDESGFQPALLAGPAWTAQMREDQATLAALWETTPWTPTPAG